MKRVNNSLILAVFILCTGLFVACGQKKNQQEPQGEQASSTLVGADKDEHGCIGSAGYIWSEVQQNCIRLFESGIRLEATDGNSAAYLVFSPDSLQVELFFSSEELSEVLDRRSLPSGNYAWNVEDDDTKNVRFVDGVWTISQRQVEIYRQSESEADNTLGAVQTLTYEGLLPCADCPGIRYDLTILSREQSEGGTFSLSLTYQEAEDGKDATFITNGKRLTLKGMPGNDNATIWQLVSDKGNEVVNFLYEDDSTLTLLGEDFTRAESNLNYSLKLVKKQ